MPALAQRQHLQQRFEWLEQRALLSARCEAWEHSLWKLRIKAMDDSNQPEAPEYVT